MEKNLQNIIVCGDFNIAHQEIILPNPHIAYKSPGFLPQESIRHIH
jgi:exonuclease III